MSIVNQGPATDIARDVNKIKSIITRLVKQTNRSLRECVKIVEGQKAELLVELGDDSDDLNTVYNAYKAILESAEIGYTVSDLPD